MSEDIKPLDQWMYMRPAVDAEEADLELEFKVYSFELMAVTCDAMEDGRTASGNRDKQIESWLTDGWQIDQKIICPPYVMLIFSREKEIAQNEE